jgi:hypothetical protein
MAKKSGAGKRTAGAVRSVERVLNTLVQARKAARLYPVGNPRVRESLSNAVRAAGEMFTNENVQTGEQSGADQEGPTLFLSVGRDTFYFDDEPISGRQESVRLFADELYRHGAKFFWIRSGVNFAEMERFVNEICNRPESVPLARATQEVTLEHVGLEVIDSLDLVEGTQTPKDTDLLTHLQQRRAGRTAGGLAEPFAAASPSDETEDISDLTDFFSELAEGASDNKDYLFSTLTNPHRLSETLSYIASLRSTPVSEEPSPSGDVMRQTLRHIADSIKALPEDMRENIVQNIAEAVLSSGDETKQVIMDDTLASQLGAGGIEDEIARAMPDDQVADLLSSNVRIHDGTQNSISNFIDEFSEDESHRLQMKNMLAENLSRYGGKHYERARSLMAATEDEIDPAAAPERRQKRDEVAALEEVRDKLAKELAMLPTEETELDVSLQSALGKNGTDEAALVILYLQKTDYIDPVDGPRALAVDRALHDALDEGRFDYIAECLSVALERTPPERHKAIKQGLHAFLYDLTATDNLRRLINCMMASNTETRAYSRMRKLLQSMGERGIRTVFSALAKEQGRKRRQGLLRLFVEFHEAALPYLAQRIDKEEWYIVRNVVHLIGQIGSPKGIPTLERVLYHQDIRVRREVLRALGAIKNEDAEKILIQCLDDSEPIIQALAAEWLGVIGDATALPIFRDRIQNDARALLRQPDVAVSFINSVGRIGDESDIRLLRKLNKGGLFSRRQEKVSRACEEAIEGIEARMASASRTVRGTV